MEKPIVLKIEDREPDMYRIGFQTLNNEKDRCRYGYHKIEANPQILHSQSKLTLQGYKDPFYMNPNEIKTNNALNSGFCGRKQDKQWTDSGTVFSKNVERYRGYSVSKKHVKTENLYTYQ